VAFFSRAAFWLAGILVRFHTLNIAKRRYKCTILAIMVLQLQYMRLELLRAVVVECFFNLKGHQDVLK